MVFRRWLQPPRHLLPIFVGVTVLPGAALVWLGWHLVQQDRALERQRIDDWLERAAQIVVAGLQNELEAQVGALKGTRDLPPGATGVTLTPAGTRTAGLPLVFVPVVSRQPEAPAAVWSHPESLEFVDRDLAAAGRAYRAIALSSPDPQVRAAGFILQARTLRVAGKLRDAAEAYARAAAISSARFHGDPADLVARLAQCDMLEQLGAKDELRRQAASLAKDLHAARWQIGRATYVLAAERVTRWTGDAPATHEQIARAQGLDLLWTAHGSGSLPSAGHRVTTHQGASIALAWEAQPAVFRALAVPVDRIVAGAAHQWQDLGVEVGLLEPGGGLLAGSLPSSPLHILRSTGATSLPWDVRVTATIPADGIAATASRRPVLLGGLALLVFLIPAGGFVVARAVQRELATARVQKDFVSAVSHELRSPLTTMAHMTEMLSSGRVADAQRQREYYSVLGRETDRLRRFVETLLDFGRMEAGALRYLMEPHDPGVLVAAIAEEFRRTPSGGAHAIRIRASAPLPAVRVNRDAFGRALWNLLENAAKYSPAGSLITVELTTSASHVAIHVRDRGPGVPAHERLGIFRQFVRGAAAERTGVKGTGVGLALADQIVTAHGGAIRLESEVGLGSTFTIVLPAAEELIT